MIDRDATGMPTQIAYSAPGPSLPNRYLGKEAMRDLLRPEIETRDTPPRTVELTQSELESLVEHEVREALARARCGTCGGAVDRERE